jgi:hypothetical protein
MSDDQISGLWTAEFGSSAGVSGGGIAVFRQGRILGGDGTCFYVGDYRLNGEQFVATLRVSPFIEGAESVFRTKGQTLTLELAGSFTKDGHGIGQGHPREIPSLKFGVKLTKRE